MSSYSTHYLPDGSGGSFSCFHGEKGKRPPVKDDTLMDTNNIKRMFYEEAARRLPLIEIPGLEGCICAGGLCVGLANIILNAIGLLLHDRQPRRGS